MVVPVGACNRWVGVLFLSGREYKDVMSIVHTDFDVLELTHLKTTPMREFTTWENSLESGFELETRGGFRGGAAGR